MAHGKRADGAEEGMDKGLVETLIESAPYVGVMVLFLAYIWNRDKMHARLHDSTNAAIRENTHALGKNAAVLERVATALIRLNGGK